MENEITRALLLTRESSQDYVFYQLETGEMGNMEEEVFTERVIRKCNDEITRINGLEMNATMSDHSKIVKNLWVNRHMGDNEETLEIMIKSKNKMRETLELIRTMDAG